MTLPAVLARIDTQMPKATARLLEFLRIPSISTDPAYADSCQDAADWLVADLRSIGVTAEKRTTPKHPMVVGHAGQDAPPDAPHLLFYGHYDVQPVDPLALWTRDPFDPAVEQTPKGEVIRGRGTSDDKGQLMTFVEACRAWREVNGTLPCRITFFFEGEEESGSPSLVPFMKENAEELLADIALICDTGLFQSKTPAIVTMLRGMVSDEVTITGPDKDLHSGFFGGIAANPIHVLSRILTGLHDSAGRVTLPGFYDNIPDLSPETRAQWLQGQEPRYQKWTEILAAVGIFGVFSGIPFMVVTILLALSIIACTTHRLPLLYNQAMKPRIRVRPTFFDHARVHATTVVKADEDAALHAWTQAQSAANTARSTLAETRARITALTHSLGELAGEEASGAVAELTQARDTAAQCVALDPVYLPSFERLDAECEAREAAAVSDPVYLARVMAEQRRRS